MYLFIINDHRQLSRVSGEGGGWENVVSVGRESPGHNLAPGFLGLVFIWLMQGRMLIIDHSARHRLLLGSCTIYISVVGFCLRCSFCVCVLFCF